MNRKLVLVLVSLSIVLSPIYIYTSIIYTQENVNTFSPDVAVRLGSGTAGTSVIGVNGTTAIVDVSAGSGTIWLYVNAYDGTRTDWTRVGTSPYLDAIDYNAHYTYVSGNNKLLGDFGFADSGKSTETIDSVTVQLYTTQSSSNSKIQVYVWDGSTWTSLGLTIIDTYWTWTNWTATTVLDTWTKIDDAKIYFQSESAAGVYEVDCARLQVNYTSPNTYDYILSVTSQKAYDQNISLNLYNYSNINRLSNCTIWFRDGSTSVQINITNGLVVQDIGSWYLLPAGETRYIVVHVEESASGTSVLFIELEAVKASSIVYTCLIELKVN